MLTGPPCPSCLLASTLMMVEPSVVGCTNLWLWSSLDALHCCGSALGAPLGCGNAHSAGILAAVKPWMIIFGRVFKSSTVLHKFTFETENCGSQLVGILKSQREDGCPYEYILSSSPCLRQPRGRRK